MSLPWLCLNLISLVIIVLFILTRCSQTLKYYIKFTAFCIAQTFVNGFCIPFALFIRPGSSKNIFIIQNFIKLVQIEWLFGLDIKFENVEILNDVEKPVVIVANHQSVMDAIILLKELPNNTSALAKQELLYVPVFGVACWLFGVFFVDRSKHRSAIDTMKSVGARMRKQNTSIVIFAEGTRNQVDRIVEFKKGAFHLAIQAEVPIVPVVIMNYRNVLDSGNRMFEGGEIRVKVLPPVDTNDLEVDELRECVHGMMSTSFREDQEKHAELYEHLVPLKEE